MTYHLRIYHVVFVTHDGAAAVAVAVASRCCDRSHSQPI